MLILWGSLSNRIEVRSFLLSFFSSPLFPILPFLFCPFVHLSAHHSLSPQVPGAVLGMAGTFSERARGLVRKRDSIRTVQEKSRAPGAGARHMGTPPPPQLQIITSFLAKGHLSLPDPHFCIFPGLGEKLASEIRHKDIKRCHLTTRDMLVNLRLLWEIAAVLVKSLMSATY